MAKFRAVLLVPTVVEIESEGSWAHVTEQARRIARGMGKAESHKEGYAPYEPKLMEVSLEEGQAPDYPKIVA